MPFSWSIFPMGIARSHGHFYAEFAPHQQLLGIVTAKGTAKEDGGRSKPGMESTSIKARIHAQVVQAVRIVHREDVDANAPLLQAGLDSLGMPHFISSPCTSQCRAACTQVLQTTHLRPANDASRC